MPYASKVKSIYAQKFLKEQYTEEGYQQLMKAGRAKIEKMQVKYPELSKLTIAKNLIQNEGIAAEARIVFWALLEEFSEE